MKPGELGTGYVRVLAQRNKPPTRSSRRRK